MVRVYYTRKIGPFFSLLMFSTMLQAAQANELHKVFYHRSGITDGVKGGKTKQAYKKDETAMSAQQLLDLGKVVFYFDNEPLINRLPSTNMARNELITEFIIPAAQAKSIESKKMLSKLNSTSGPLYEGKPLYKVLVEQITLPTKGLKITISYNQQRVRYQMKSFDSITNQKGVVIYFYDQALLDEIKRRGANVLTTGFNRKRSIWVDCGHGGYDTGAAGFFNTQAHGQEKIEEKNVSLGVGLELAQVLKKKGFTVFLTRDRDVFVDLDDRTTFANRSGVDLFVSIHANHTKNSAVSGLETWCLTKELFKEKMASEDGQLCTLADVCGAKLYERSSSLADSVHKNVVAHAKKTYTLLADRGIRHSVAQVLLGTNMPAVLVELGFLSNKKESELLSSKSYQKILARGICAGIESYLYG